MKVDKEKAAIERKKCVTIVSSEWYTIVRFFFFLTQRGRIFREGITKRQQIAEGKK